MEALSHLQELTHNRAEIIPGVISDPCMEDRAQVILVITGLGATPIETALPARKPQAQPVQQAHPEPVPVSRASIPLTSAQANQVSREIPPAATDNLDLPAFLRRRVRQTP